MGYYSKKELSKRPLSVKALLNAVAKHPNYKAFKVGNNLAIHRIPASRKHKQKVPAGTASYTIKNGAQFTETNGALFNRGQRKDIAHHLYELFSTPEDDL